MLFVHKLGSFVHNGGYTVHMVGGEIPKLSTT